MKYIVKPQFEHAFSHTETFSIALLDFSAHIVID